MRKSIGCIVAITCVLLLMGCASKGSENDGQSRGDNAASDNRFPFTGEHTEDAIDNRAVAVMVSNQVQARPQTGLQEADIIFEFLTEGNITRYMALYQSEFPEKIGPVRSAREYFFMLADHYNAIYMYQGAADVVNELIQEREIEHIQGLHFDNDGKVFVREDFRVTPHNSYVISNGIYDVAKEKGYETTYDYESLAFLDEDEKVEGRDANYAKIDYYGGKPVMEFMYDEASKKYMQKMDGELTADLETEEAITVDNVFIVETDHEVIDKQKRRKIDIESGGNGYLLRHGKAEEVEWKNEDGYIIPVNDGETVPFAIGNTWIIFVQTDPEPGVVEQVVIDQVE